MNTFFYIISFCVGVYPLLASDSDEEDPFSSYGSSRGSYMEMKEKKERDGSSSSDDSDLEEDFVHLSNHTNYADPPRYRPVFSSRNRILGHAAVSAATYVSNGVGEFFKARARRQTHRAYALPDEPEDEGEWMQGVLSKIREEESKQKEEETKEVNLLIQKYNSLWTSEDTNILLDIMNNRTSQTDPPDEAYSPLKEPNDGMTVLIGEFFKKRSEESRKERTTLQKDILMDTADGLNYMQKAFEMFVFFGLIREKDRELYQEYFGK